MSKHFSSKEELHNKILNGVRVLADNVASTLGPRGRNVILQEKGKMPQSEFHLSSKREKEVSWACQLI